MGRCGLDTSGSGYGPVMALVNTVMNLRDPYKVGNLLTSWVILASLGGLCSVEFVTSTETCAQWAGHKSE